MGGFFMPVNPEGLAASVTAAAVAIVNSLSDDETELLASVLVQLSDTLNTLLIAKKKNI